VKGRDAMPAFLILFRRVNVAFSWRDWWLVPYFSSLVKIPLAYITSSFVVDLELFIVKTICAYPVLVSGPMNVLCCIFCFTLLKSVHYG
jgi:hypothetical protein